MTALLPSVGFLPYSSVLPAHLPSSSQIAWQIGSSLVSYVIIKWGTTVWVPRVVNHYGFAYFEWKKPYLPGLLSNILIVMAQMALVHAASAGHPPLSRVFLAMMCVALYGTLRADARFQLIPDRFQALGTVGALGWVGTTCTTGSVVPWLQAGMGLVVAGSLWAITTLYSKVRRRDGLGFGDIKLLAWLGVAMGPANLDVLAYGAAAAGLVMLPLLLFRRRQMDAAFAFGPYLVLGCVVHGFLQSLGG